MNKLLAMRKESVAPCKESVAPDLIRGPFSSFSRPYKNGFRVKPGTTWREGQARNDESVMDVNTI
jgi:hypothetical protein